MVITRTTELPVAACMPHYEEFTLLKSLPDLTFAGSGADHRMKDWNSSSKSDLPTWPYWACRSLRSRHSVADPLETPDILTASPASRDQLYSQRTRDTRNARDRYQLKTLITHGEAHAPHVFPFPRSADRRKSEHCSTYSAGPKFHIVAWEHSNSRERGRPTFAAAI